MKARAKVLIVGTGALATFFAARLSAAGADITLLGSWPEGLAALRAVGARLADDGGTFPVRVAENAAACRGARTALVLVKAWQTERAALQLSDCLEEDGLALTLQNGIGNREILIRFLGAKRVALGVTTLGAALLEPGLVRPAGDGVISLEKCPRLRPLEALFRLAGFSVETVEDATSLVWGKLVINAAINPLTALLRLTNGELLANPAAHDLMKQLARETAAVAQALGIALPFADPVVAVEDVARRTAGNRSSMLQDVLRHAPTEIDAINGKIARLGEQVGMPTPVNRTVFLLIKSLAN
jgi:2-dehydropantoate 2-reductase